MTRTKKRKLPSDYPLASCRLTQQALDRVDAAAKFLGMTRGRVLAACVNGHLPLLEKLQSSGRKLTA